MRNKSIKHLLLALSLGLLSFQFQSCSGNKDPEIQTAISSATQTSPDLANVSATVDNGNVILTGQCKDDRSRRKAEKAIKDIDGVKDVVNNIMIATSNEVVSDKELKKNTERVISDYKKVQADVNNGIITLRGELKQEKLQQLMMDLNALHPQRIDNQLAVK